MGWLIENGLALYGAIAGTAALGISYLSHRHNVDKDSIKLSVSFAPHPRQLENIERMLATDGSKPWEQPNLTAVALVTVRNLGVSDAPLDDVGIFTSDGEKISALVSRENDQSLHLYSVKDAKISALPPKSSQTFPVYLRRGQPMFKPRSAYAVDQTGKIWGSHA